MELAVILLILGYGMIGWFLYSQLAPVKGLKTLTNREFAEQLKNSNNKILIDVRVPREYELGHIPGAVNIPLPDLKKRIKEIPQDKEIFLYCRSGMRSKQAARILSHRGFRNLKHLHGGIMAWDEIIHY